MVQIIQKKFKIKVVAMTYTAIVSFCSYVTYWNMFMRNLLIFSNHLLVTIKHQQNWCNILDLFRIFMTERCKHKSFY